THIEVRHEDYDLVCPSDYMAERMIKDGLVQKVNTEIFDTFDADLFYDGLAEMISPFDKNNEYFVPYIWGTFGIMYDVNKIDAGSDAMKSWSALWSQDYNKHILMKDSVRDAYSVARIYGNRDKLSELSDGFTDYNEAYRAELVKYFSEIDQTLVNEAKTTLLQQRPVLLKYEVDDGKNDMLAGTTEAWLGLFWSCDSGLIMQEDGGDHFYYEVPKEGSNVWVDGWLIPAYSANPDAANYFLKFIYMHEYARINYDYLGNTLAVKSVMDEVKAELESDEDGFFADTYDGFKQMYIDMMFPSESVLARCGVMRDFGKAMNTALDSMWIDVRAGH
ncbi:MAG: extracellular solute-binding protein, partial [Clostridia bacterium]|nr:extracellular solute-binding protein [Clostridia bacterium]